MAPVYVRPVPCVIYALVDPRDWSVRYIGESVRPHRRLRDHLEDKQLLSTSKKNCWLNDLLASGGQPVMVPLEFVLDGLWASAERRWIAYYRVQSAPLTNTHEGGGGPPLGYRHTAGARVLIAAASGRRVKSRAERQRMSASMKARMAQDAEFAERLVQRGKALQAAHPLGPEQVARGAAAQRGRKQDPETIQKRVMSLRGKRRPPEQRQAASERQRRVDEERRAAGTPHPAAGRKHSAQTIERMKRAQQNRPAEQNQRAAASHRGLTVGEEGRARMREAQRARRARERQEAESNVL